GRGPVSACPALGLCFALASARGPGDLPAFPTRRSSDLVAHDAELPGFADQLPDEYVLGVVGVLVLVDEHVLEALPVALSHLRELDRKSTRLNSSHVKNSYAVSRFKKKQ